MIARQFLGVVGAVVDWSLIRVLGAVSDRVEGRGADCYRRADAFADVEADVDHLEPFAGFESLGAQVEAHAAESGAKAAQALVDFLRSFGVGDGSAFGGGDHSRRRQHHHSRPFGSRLEPASTRTRILHHPQRHHLALRRLQLERTHTTSPRQTPLPSLGRHDHGYRAGPAETMTLICNESNGGSHCQRSQPITHE